ncbi:hypothetical protein DTO012A9_2383 [Penicillium roqueforti]|nr:hypothetical protein LCP963914a_2383 [Penicillium roqueforti]KAI3142219.1 hypothetical protein CBS147330_6 [Penicillium roqueforti]KAI3177070.1 hypothetical protein DTO039G3_429 [Penicillium roqueforti]KAI3237147.1 hypothetical protein CBS147310_3028 [Penicillium roqueforti]KAI3263169.1 hypothetical protein DTO012A9_2383 [Penicillium roqueforti]
MGSHPLLQPLRPRKHPKLQCAPLDLQMSLKRRLSKARHDLMTVRGSASSPIVENDPQEFTMPANIAEPDGQSVPSLEPCMPPGTKETKESHCQSQGQDHKEEEVPLGEIGDSCCASPESSIIDLDALDFSDSEISSLSTRDSLRSASRLARFFPELSSHFSVVSPVGADRNMEQLGPSLFERELEERVLILYRYSADVDPEHQQSISQSLGSDGYDGGSSCYSRRTSITTLGTEFWGDDGRYPHKSPDAYSIHSPVVAGVFDDIALSRRSSTVPPYTLHMPSHEGPAKQVSMTDLKNKPLPLEPAHSDDLVSHRWSDSSRSSGSPPLRPHVPTSQRDLVVSPLHPTSPVGRKEWKSTNVHKVRTHRQTGHVWFGSEYNEIPSHYRRGPQGENEQQVHSPGPGLTPTLSQATKDLEGTLAGLNKDQSPKKHLEGPAQVSRGKGDWISTRKAPLPPQGRPDIYLTPKKPKEPSGRSKSTPSPTKGSNRRDHSDLERTPRAKETREERSHSSPSRSSANDDKKDKKKKSFLAPFRKQSQGRISARSESQPHMTNTQVSDHLQLPRLQTEDLATATLLERVVEHFLSGSPGGPKPAGQSDAHKAEVRNKMRQSWALVSTAQASSLKMTDQIHELPAEPHCPSPVISRSEIPSNARAPGLPPDMPLDLILSTMEKIDSLDDLFNFALVNRKTYRAFKCRELPLIKNALFKMSPPAWELREMSPPWEMEWQPLIDPDSQVPEYTPTLYLQRYAQDIYTLAKLKALVLARCSPFLRHKTVRGLAGVDDQRAEEVDDAFWRIWTFCRIFGSGKSRENDLPGQMDWLRGGCEAKKYSTSSSTMTQPFGINNVLFEPPTGFGRGNLSGLSQRQMYDMTEIWTCMGVLLQPLHGKCIEARKVGIFDNMDVPDNDKVREEVVLEEWTSYILTLGLGAVLALSSVCQSDTTFVKFSVAQSIGLTKWETLETETSRSSFLKEAISRAYEIQERDSSPAKPPTSHYLSPARQSRERQTAFAKELRNRRARGLEEPEGRFSFSTERPMSKYSAILRNLDGTDEPVPPVPTLVIGHSSESVEISEPHTPVESSPEPSFACSRTPPPHIPLPAPLPVRIPPPRPQVLDPVDRAIDMIVNDLGFATEDAKWALKITDTGEGIDADAAVQLLKKQKKKNERNPFGKRDSLLSSVIKRQKSHESGWRWA